MTDISALPRDETNKRILITGGTGLLGQALLRTAPAGGRLFGTYLPGKLPTSRMPCPFFPWDVRDKDQVTRLFEQTQPDVVNDTKNKPLYALNCAQVVWAAVQQNKAGVYHATGADHITLFDLALKTAQVFNLDPVLIDPVPSSFFPEIASRPRDTSFDTTKMETELNVKPMTIEEGLACMKMEWKANP